MKIQSFSKFVFVIFIIFINLSNIIFLSLFGKTQHSIDIMWYFQVFNWYYIDFFAYLEKVLMVNVHMIYYIFLFEFF